MTRTAKLLVGVIFLVGLTALCGVLVALTGNVAAASGGTASGAAASGEAVSAAAYELQVAAGEQVTTSYTSDTASTSETEQYAEGVIDIVLGETISVSGEGATVEGATVRITAAGVYSISGTLADGSIDVDAKGKVYLEFDGVDIRCSSGPALTITDAKKVTITLVQGTTNYLADAASDSEYDAALFTNDTLIINGNGTLVVTGDNNEGISSDDDIIINSGTVWVTAVDDGLNAHDDITITDGDVYIISGGDGLDSNGTINISGGMLISLGSSEGSDGGLDALGALNITGGLVIATGGSVSVPSSDSTQASVYVAAGAPQPAGTVVTVTRDGEEILAFTSDAGFQNMLISSSRLIAGAIYQVYVSTSDVTLSVTADITPAGAGTTDAASSPGLLSGEQP